MAADIPTIEPSSFIIGDTVKFTKSLPDYPASDSNVLSYSFVNASGTFSATSTADGDNHAVVITAATTAELTAGDYRWQAYITNGSERYSVGVGSVTVLPNFADGAVDARSHIKKVLDALEAVFEGRATSDQASMTIQGRQLVRMAPAELIQFQSFYEKKYAAEVKAERQAAGMGHRGKIKIRFRD